MYRLVCRYIGSWSFDALKIGEKNIFSRFRHGEPMVKYAAASFDGQKSANEAETLWQWSKRTIWHFGAISCGYIAYVTVTKPLTIAGLDDDFTLAKRLWETVDRRAKKYDDAVDYYGVEER